MATEFERIIDEMRMVYLHDQRPWMIGFSGGKDSTLLCQLVFEMLETLAPEQRWKKVYIVTSDTMVENPIVKTYMHKVNKAIHKSSQSRNLNVEAHIIYPEIKHTFWSLVIGLGYPTRSLLDFAGVLRDLKLILPTSLPSTGLKATARLLFCLV